MQRLTARFLLLVALAGYFVPLALSASAGPQHACCVRKAHHCHDSASQETTQLVVSAKSDCNHDCCRALTTSHGAAPQSGMASFFSRTLDARSGDSQSRKPAVQLSASKSPRAPPQIYLA
jgi:hypothetical protein